MPTEGQRGIAPDGTPVIFRGGRVVPLTEAGGSDPQARPEWGPGARELPDGSIVRIGPRGGSTTLRGATKPTDAPPDIKEFQANAAARATLMDQGWSDYQKAVKAGYNPSSWKNQFARALEGWGPGNFMADVIRDNPSEQGRAAELQFVDGALRTTSGANAPEPEVVRANRAYFRQPGEGPGADVNKAELRRRFRDQSVRIAGPAYMAPKGEKENPIVIPNPSALASLPDGAFYRYRDDKGAVVYQRKRGAGGQAPRQTSAAAGVKVLRKVRD